MKKLFVLLVTGFMTVTGMHAQDPVDSQLYAAVAKLSHAGKAGDYQKLAKTFADISEKQPANWLSWYYAALCNAKVGLIYRNDPSAIEPFVRKSDAQIRKALGLLNRETQKKELSEVYCVLSMVSRANAFMSGSNYSPSASQYIELARHANPANPRALYLEGAENFFKPKIFGGNKKKAKEFLELASRELANQQTSSSKYPQWGKREVEEILKQF